MNVIMANVSGTGGKFDLEERTARFGENIIDLCKLITKNAITLPLISQLVKSGTSVGANYMEANGACSRKDFASKIYICKKEAQETKHWLRMLCKAEGSNQKERIKILWKETQELVMIFQKITTSFRNKTGN